MLQVCMFVLCNHTLGRCTDNVFINWIVVRLDKLCWLIVVVNNTQETDNKIHTKRAHKNERDTKCATNHSKTTFSQSAKCRTACMV
jgi:hypothetical protein